MEEESLQEPPDLPEERSGGWLCRPLHQEGSPLHGGHLMTKTAKREQRRRADEAAKADRKKARSTGFQPYRSDGVPGTTRTVAEASRR